MAKYCFHIELNGAAKEAVIAALARVTGCAISHASSAVETSLIIFVDTDLDEDAAMAQISAVMPLGVKVYKTTTSVIPPFIDDFGKKISAVRDKYNVASSSTDTPKLP